MKATIDLPRELALRLKITAASRGGRVKAVATETFRNAMKTAGKPIPKTRRGTMTLPFFPCAPDAPARHMSTAQLLALEQESQNQEDRARLGLSH